MQLVKRASRARHWCSLLVLPPCSWALLPCSGAWQVALLVEWHSARSVVSTGIPEKLPVQHAATGAAAVDDLLNAVIKLYRYWFLEILENHGILWYFFAFRLKLIKKVVKYHSNTGKV